MKPVFFGWWVVGCTFLMALWSWGLGFYGTSIYLVALRQQHQWSTGTVSAAITVYYVIGAALMTGVGDAMRRFGARGTVLAGIAAMGAGVAALTAVTAPWQMHAAFALMAVGWSTLSSASINILLAPWFERRRGVAVSLALTGATCGGMIVAPLLLTAIDAFGYRAAIALALAAMTVTLVPAVLLTLRHSPVSLGLGPDGAAPAPAADRVPGLSGMGGTAGARGARAEALRSPRYWTISVAFGLGLAAQVGMLTHFIAFLAPIHGTAGAASALGVTTFTALIARFAVGALLDQFDRRAVSAVVLLTQATGLLLLLLGSSSAALYAGCALFGIGVGNMVTLPGLLLQREVRAEHFAAVIGLLAATNQFTYSLAPGLLGMLRDATGDYQAAVLLCIGMELLGAAVIVAGHRIGKRAQAARSAGMVALQSPGAIPSGDAMLQLRPNCECCDRDLPPDSREAMICSFECTFCRTCVETVLGGRCPNCGGEFVQRPIRPPAKLAKYPASVERVVRREPPCADVA